MCLSGCSNGIGPLPRAVGREVWEAGEGESEGGGREDSGVGQRGQ